jgi:phage gp29-like protein
MSLPGYRNLSPQFLASQSGRDIGRIDIGPIRNASPEDATAAPVIDRLVVESPERSFIPTAWLKMLTTNPDKVLTDNGGDLATFDDLLDDDVAMSNLQQRRLAITSRDWEVAPGDPDDARSVQAADDLRAMLKAVGWDRVTGLMHYAIWYGFSVGEAMFTTKDHDGRRIIWLSDIVVPNRKWFGFTVEGELQLSTGWALQGDSLPANKFWTVRTGGTDDFAFYGLGLAHWAYWPIFFKRAGIKFWALFLEKYGRPTVGIEFVDGDGELEKATRLQAAMSVGNDSAVLLPPGSIKDDLVKIYEAARTGGAASYKEFVTEQNEALMRIVLGQPGTSKATANGIGSGQADVHAGVKAEIVKADADLISESFNRTIATWLTRWNHGEDVAPPTVYRILDDEEDLNTVADRDVKLDGIGIKRTEDSVRETYGDGYELDRLSEEDKAAQAAALVAAKSAPGAAPPANDNRAAGQAKIAKRRAEFGVEDAAPLYVSRKLLPASAKALLAWAKEQGFKDLEPASELHCTVLRSKTPVDWFDMGDDWGGSDEVSVGKGGPRAVKQFDGGAIVLRFANLMFKYRHESMIERGASSDHPEYKPHVTFAHDATGVDLAALEPFTGELRFGPEIFEPINTPDPIALAFAAGDEDAIDRVVARLLEDTSPVFSAIAGELREGLQGITTAEGARVALLEVMEKLPLDKLAKLTALPMLAVRATASVGAENALGA